MRTFSIFLVAHGFARTPVAALDTDLAGWHPVDLAVVVAREALIRAHLNADGIDEIVVGCAEPVGAQGADAARAIVLSAGWPGRIGGMVLDRAETSGLSAVQIAADTIRAGRARRVLVIGMGMGSTVPPGAAAVNRTYGAPWGDGVAERMAGAGGLLPAPRAAELAAARSGVSRPDLDAIADRSVARRRDAPTPSALVTTAARPGEAAPTVRSGDPVAADHIREWGATGELPPAFDTEGLTTAATVAPPADAISGLVLEEGEHTGLELLGAARAAGEPDEPTGDLARAVGRVCSQHEIEVADVHLIEMVETSAATVALATRSAGLAGIVDRVNPYGGALATGDAGAAEEIRLVVDAFDRLAHGQTVVTASAGPTGSAVILWRRHDR